MKASTCFSPGDLCIEQRPNSQGYVIFGASGDLTCRKLIPALYHLYKRKLLPRNFYVIGCARTQMTMDEFRKKMHKALIEIAKISEPDLKFFNYLHYIAGNYASNELYDALKCKIVQLNSQYNIDIAPVFYMSTPPTIMETIIGQLSDSQIIIKNQDAFAHGRVVIEKPFGSDLQSAIRLDRALLSQLDENQIYRIDHYLGKETVQNILMLRFANIIFEPIWNRNYIDHIEITVSEKLGVEHRAGYFETSGLLRDIYQNHMLQMLALVAMEAPASFEANCIREEKVKLLRSIRPFAKESLQRNAIRAQYSAGQVEGQHMCAYLDENGVASDSTVETYVATRLFVDNWRWQGVPFYLRAGKKMPQKCSEIAITFKQVPHSMFAKLAPITLSPNILILNVQPEEGISLQIQAKHPGPKLCMGSLSMNFNYKHDMNVALSDAYERLLLDSMLGDQTLFVRSDALELGWKLIAPLLDDWYGEYSQSPLYTYSAGTWGPKESGALIKSKKWRL